VHLTSELDVEKVIIGVVPPLGVVGAVLIEDRALECTLDDVVDALSAVLFLRAAFFRPMLMLRE
jgi:hypothetical protein